MYRAATMLLLLTCLCGCASNNISEDALRLPESTLDVRSIQTRTMEASSELNILTATIAVLQDMEFNIERIEKPLGVITASKITDADSIAEKTGLMFLDILCVVGGSGSCGALASAKDDQHITLTMVVLPSLAREFSSCRWVVLTPTRSRRHHSRRCWRNSRERSRLSTKICAGIASAY